MKKYYVIPELKVYTLKPYCLMACSVNVGSEGALSDDGTIEDADYALGRNPDPDGYADWCNKLLYGEVNGAQVAEGILFSDEYIGQGADDASYVNTLYHVFFNRDPDPAGLEVWTNALAEGTERREIMTGFINSTEWANLCTSAGIYSGSIRVVGVNARDKSDKGNREGSGFLLII